MGIPITPGETRNRLTAIRKLSVSRVVDGKKVGARWLFKCQCGKETAILSCDFRTGRTKSCGCYCLDRLIKHGMSGTRIYAVWNSMKMRCSNPNSQAWENYGARGIAVCERWHKFENFYADMGPQPPKGLTLERKNNNDGYSPANCIWATRLEQRHNRRDSHG